MSQQSSLTQSAHSVRQVLMAYTNRVRCNLGRVLFELGNPVEALALGETALAAHDKALGPHHVWTKDSARIAADALAPLGRAEEAIALRERYAIPVSAE